MRVSIFLICLALALPTSASAATCEESVPESPSLQSSLDEIEQGLLMTDAPLNAIGDYFSKENERLQSEKRELQTEKELLQQERSNLDLREQGLNVREQDLQMRENGLADMQENLNRANKKLKRGWIWLAVAFVAGGIAGWALK